MERLKKLFGVEKPLDSHIQFDSVFPTSEVESDEPESKTNSVDHNQPVSATGLSIFKPIENSIRKAVHLQNHDCLSCKLIATSVAFGTSIFIIYWGHKNRQKYSGFRRFCWTGHYFFVSAFMMSVAVSRFFDAGVFSKKVGEDFNLSEMLQDDIEWYRGFSERISSKFTDSDKKS